MTRRLETVEFGKIKMKYETITAITTGAKSIKKKKINDEKCVDINR